jgi:hypothetical protein
MRENHWDSEINGRKTQEKLREMGFFTTLLCLRGIEVQA